MRVNAIIGIIVGAAAVAFVGIALGVYFSYDSPVARTPWPLTEIVPLKPPPEPTSWPILEYANMSSSNVPAGFTEAYINGDFVALRFSDRAVLYSDKFNAGAVSLTSEKIALGDTYLLANNTLHYFDESGFTYSNDIAGSFNVQGVLVEGGFSYISDKTGLIRRVWVFDDNRERAGLAQLANPLIAADPTFGQIIAAHSEQELLFVGGADKIYQFAYDPISSFYAPLADAVITDSALGILLAPPALVTYNRVGFRVYRPDNNNIYSLRIFQPLDGITAIAVSSHGELIAAATANQVNLYYLGPDSIRGTTVIRRALVSSIYIADDATITMVDVNQITRYGPIRGTPSS